MSRALVPSLIANLLPWRLIAVLIALVGFGVIVLYSSAGGSMTPWAAMHGVRFSILLVMAIGISFLPETWLRPLLIPAYITVLIGLIGVELLGFVGGGSQRWLDLGVMRLQPSELMKPAVVLLLAHFYAMLPPGHLRSWQALWPALVVIGIPVSFVLLQPDLGTSVAIAVGGLTVMFLAGLPMRLFIGAGLAGLAALPVFYSMLHDYQRNRVLVFLNPELDPLGAGYHISQSKIAIGSGGIFGKGFLNGSQSHLDYLPEGHTDFIFSTMAEEWGLIGGIFVIGAFVMILRWGYRVAMRSPSRFGRLAAGGLTTTIFFYFAINLLMVMGMAPAKGIPLPFMSHGGSSMLTVMICIGFLIGIGRETKVSGRSPY